MFPQIHAFDESIYDFKKNVDSSDTYRREMTTRWNDCMDLALVFITVKRVGKLISRHQGQRSSLGLLALGLVVLLGACGVTFKGLGVEPPKAPTLQDRATAQGSAAEGPKPSEPADGAGANSTNATAVPPASADPFPTTSTAKPLPTPPTILCTFGVQCLSTNGGNQLRLTYQCDGSAKPGLLGLGMQQGCGQVKMALDGVGLPNEKTVQTLQGGPTLNVSCMQGNTTFVSASGGARSESVFSLPPTVCEEFRNLLNALKI
jgi:hypothetical protein